MNKYNKAILVNEVLFSVAALIFFYLGADRVLPTGFILIVIGIAFFTMIQYFYLRKFLKELASKTKNLFLRNLIRFLLVGLCLAIMAIIVNTIMTNSFDYTVVVFNMVLINVPIAIYAIWFYLFNLVVLKIIK